MDSAKLICRLLCQENTRITKENTVQELIGHKDVRTTMIYIHVLNRGVQGVLSPAELITAH